MKNNIWARFRVYDRRGKYHQSYLLEADAKACAKHVKGEYMEITDDKKGYKKQKL
jgi:hypothetical protein